MVRSLKKGRSTAYFQYENDGHNLGIKQCECGVAESVASFKFKVSTISVHQKQDEEYLHEESLMSVTIDDKTIRDGFSTYVEQRKAVIESYKLEIESRGSVICFDVSPKRSTLGIEDVLVLNVING